MRRRGNHSGCLQHQVVYTGGTTRIATARGTVGPRDTDGFVADLPDNRPTIALTKFDGEDSLAMCHAKGPVRQ